MKRIVFVALAGLLTLGLLANSVAAQTNNIITATADRTTLTTDEMLTLTVTIDQASGATEPVAPSLAGFNVLGTSSGTQVSIINGDMSVQATTTYYLQPVQTGQVVIDPFTTTSNGQTFQTDPIVVDVAQGTGQFQPSIPSMPGMPNLGNLIPNMPATTPNQAPPPVDGGTLPAPEGLNGQDYYVEAVVDNANPWQGEQVLYKFRFYQGASLLVEPNLSKPDFTGFWHNNAPEQTTYTTEANGRTYYVTELTTVLFPTVSGPTTIDPSVMELPGGFFSGGQTLNTQPVAVDVKPLPADPPAGFQGAVGQFSIQSLVDKTASQVNDAVNLQVTLSGAGNIETLPDLTWDVGPAWRAFDPQVESNSSFANGQLQGSRISKQVLVPTQPGSLTIDPIPFTYFDPQTAEYKTIATQPIVVQVAPNPNTTAQDIPAIGAGASASVGLEMLGLRPMKASPSSWRSSPGAIAATGGYWALLAVPLLLLLGVAGYGAARKYRDATADERQRSQAAAKAQSALKQARNNPEEAAAVAGRTLNTYMTTKLEQPTTGLTRDALGELLHEHGVDADLIHRVQRCLQDSETAAYFPGFSDSGVLALLDEVGATISELDAVLS